MATETNHIQCPNCGHDIDVNEILYHQIEENIKKNFAAKLSEEKKKYDSELEKLAREKEQFEETKRNENKIFADRLKAEGAKIEQQVKAKLLEEQSGQFELLQKELNEKSEQIKELGRTRAEIEKLKREKSEIKEAVEAESQKKLNELILLEKDKIRKVEEEKNELRFKELQKQLEDQKKLTEEMVRKQEQGSMQLQGEVQELAIEDWLTSQFPLDTIEEIKKGARGGDCIQVVNTRTHQNCGSIYYESKRTKEFQSSWIEKFKSDMREKGTTFGVIVTDAMPKDMTRLGQKDGIWICTLEEFKGLSTILRESVILLSHALKTHENKGDKMNMLYSYLTGNEFRMQVEAIVEGFTQMNSDLDSERRAMEGIWKKRKTQIDKVLLNTNYMYNQIKGIAGNAIQSVKSLELPEGNNDNSQD